VSEELVSTPLPQPDDPGMVAWRTFLTAHASVIRQLEAELEQRQSLALSDFDVLVQLHFAGGTLRMRDLADSVLLSRSGMTRRVDRLEEAGYVSRFACETDRRGSMAQLTDAGRERLEGAHYRSMSAGSKPIFSQSSARPSSRWSARPCRKSCPNRQRADDRALSRLAPLTAHG
jgi:DNA-binding MarR family transcriptional regulator